MDFDLESLNKNDFLPLSQNIKQELFDTNNEETACDSPPVNVRPPAAALILLRPSLCLFVDDGHKPHLPFPFCARPSYLFLCFALHFTYVGGT